MAVRQLCAQVEGGEHLRQCICSPCICPPMCSPTQELYSLWFAHLWDNIFSVREDSAVALGNAGGRGRDTSSGRTRVVTHRRNAPWLLCMQTASPLQQPRPPAPPALSCLCRPTFRLAVRAYGDEAVQLILEQVRALSAYAAHMPAVHSRRA